MEDTHKTKLFLDLELVGHGVLGKGGALVTGVTSSVCRGWRAGSPFFPDAVFWGWTGWAEWGMSVHNLLHLSLGF